MTCDFSTYNNLRADTQLKSQDAASACNAVEVAQAKMEDAQQELADAVANKEETYEAWQKAERAENTEAAKLGIDPVPPTSPPQPTF